MKNSINKIILGSVNFGLKYGFKNKKISNKEISKILNLANIYGIKTFETSQSYGDSEKKLGLLKKNKNFKFITKISNLKKNISHKETINILNNSRIKLNVHKIDCIMFHDYREFIYNNFSLPKFFLKQKGKLFNKIGVSIHSPKELYNCLKFKKLDCIQIPYNIIDYRWNKVDFKKIKKKNKKIKIHVRSIFLRGMLPNRVKYLPKWFNKKNELQKVLNEIKKKQKINLKQILFNFVYQQKWIDKIIIGVSSKKQLTEIKKFYKLKKTIKFNNSVFNFIPSKLLMPKYW